MIDLTEKDKNELIYLLNCAPIEISCQNKKIIPMNGFWYPYNENGSCGKAFDNFHSAVVWLLNPLWENLTSHLYE